MKTLHYLLVSFIVATIISLIISLIIYIIYIGYKFLDTNFVLGAFLIILPFVFTFVFIISLFHVGEYF